MIPKKDLQIKFTKGKGPGGQHKNKVETMAVVTHLPTGIVTTADGRHRHRNLKRALAEMERRVREVEREAKAKLKKQRRDKKIHERDVIRTYDYGSGIVKDHRTGKKATIKQIIGKGKIDLLTDGLHDGSSHT